MFDWIGDFFKSVFDIIPKMIYLLYASLACLLDIFQLVLRKLAGLDVYYDAQGNMISGDIVTNFIAGIFGININGGNAHFDYSPLATVFWSMIVFGVIIAFVAVFVAIIKSHYNYDEKAAKGPMQYVYTGLRALINMAAVPVIVILGLFVSQAILTALDNITSNTSASIADFNTDNLEYAYTTRGQASGTGEKTYVFYDLFGYECGIRYGSNSVQENFQWDGNLSKIASSTTTFSGALFKTAAYNGNRVRTGHIRVKATNIYGFEQNGIFAESLNNVTDTDWRDKAANMIDSAFANNLHLKSDYLRSHAEVRYDKDGAGEWTSAKYMLNFFTRSIPSFSKFNVGAVWYYYDLWNFNFIVGFGACVVCVSLFINIILGLITRIFLSVGLFLVAPPLFGLAPFDEGKAAKSWRENFVKQVLMAYGAIVGMNIFFVILPIMNQINFFNIAIADLFMQTLIIIVGLITIKAFISTVSGLIGAEDANKAGEGIKEDVAKTMATGAKMTVGAATMPYKLAKGAVQGGLAVKNAAQALDNAIKQHDLESQANVAERGNRRKNRLMRRSFNRIKTGEMDQAEFRSKAARVGMTDTQANEMFNAINASDSVEEARGQYYNSGTDAAYNGNVNAARPYREYASFRGRLKNDAVGRMNSHVTMAGEGLSSAFTFVNDWAKNDKGVKAFEETIYKPKDYGKLNYEETKKFREGMMGYDEQTSIGPFKRRGPHHPGAMENLRHDVGNVHDAMNAGFAGTQGAITGMHGDVNTRLDNVRTDMNTGFTGTQGAITGMHGDVNTRLDNVRSEIQAGNTKLDAVEKNTAQAKKAIDRTQGQLLALNKRAKKAQQDRADVKQKQDDLLKKVKKINK